MTVPDSDQVHQDCICGDCPSYPANDVWSYCARGKSDKGIDRVNCICPECPVTDQYDLVGTYYCISGAAD
ncbi:MAG: DUF2769 domain-containing protein [Actinomycetota bacterium]